MLVDYRSLVTPETIGKSTFLHSYFVHYGKCFSSANVSSVCSCDLPFVVKCQIISSLRTGLKRGSLVIQDGDEVLHFGQTDKDELLLSGRITVVNGNFWARVYLSHDLGCKLLFRDSSQ
jgi:cyclopropane-fatty-acyl-phospholipid synthase